MVRMLTIETDTEVGIKGEHKIVFRILHGGLHVVVDAPIAQFNKRQTVYHQAFHGCYR